MCKRAGAAGVPPEIARSVREAIRDFIRAHG
jgi:hypothetical protein